VRFKLLARSRSVRSAVWHMQFVSCPDSLQIVSRKAA